MRVLRLLWAAFGLLVLLAALLYLVIDPAQGQESGGRCFMGGFFLLIVLVTATVGEMIGQARHDSRHKRRGFGVVVNPPRHEGEDAERHH